MKQICRVEVFLDDNVPECMDGIIRIGSVISYDSNDYEIENHQELVDNTEFHEISDLIEYVATKLDISRDIIEVLD